MEERCGRYVRTLWVLAALFKITQYLCAAILTAGKLANDVTFRLALESLGPFFAGDVPGLPFGRAAVRGSGAGGQYHEP